MSVDTKTVEGRRELRFNSFDDLRIAVDQLAAGNVKMLGNWSLAQVFKHLAASLNATIDGSSIKASFFLRLMAPLMKKKFIYRGIPAGFKIPKEAQAQFLPSNAVETADALDQLQAAIERVQSADTIAPHPLFGNLSKEELEQFQLRHAELHLSFAVPVE